MHSRSTFAIFLIFFIAVFATPAFSQNKPAKKAEKAERPAAAAEADEDTGEPTAVELTLPEFVQRFVNENLTIRNQRADIKGADTALQSFNGKYGWNLNVTGAKEYQTSTEDIAAEVYAEDGSVFNIGTFVSGGTGNPNEINGGSRSTSYTETDEGSVALSKSFASGTTVSTGVRQTITETDSTALGVSNRRSGSTFGETGTVTQDIYGLNRQRSSTTSLQGGRLTWQQSQKRQIVPVVFLTLEQELLRNVFGRKDRLDRKILKKEVGKARATLDEAISQSVAGAINQYWNLEIARINLQISRRSEGALRRVRNITARKVGIGLSERYELNQWNSRLHSARIQLESADLAYKQSLRGIARTLNMRGQVKITHKGNLLNKKPDINIADAQANALKYRADYRNAQRSKEIAEMKKVAAVQGLLPSLKAKMDATSSGLDGRWGEAADQAASGRNPGWRVEMQLSVPLWRDDLIVEKRDANLEKAKANNDIERIKREVMDDVRDKHETAAMQYRHLDLNRKARIQMEAYYNRLIRQSTLGRVGSVTLYDALTSYLDAYKSEQESLVNYNMALLNLSLAQNTLFTDLRVRFPQLENVIEAEKAE